MLSIACSANFNGAGLSVDTDVVSNLQNFQYSKSYCKELTFRVIADSAVSMPPSSRVPLSQVCVCLIRIFEMSFAKELFACVSSGQHKPKLTDCCACAVLHAGTMPEIFSGERNPDNGGLHALMQTEHIKMCQTGHAKSPSSDHRYGHAGACYLYARSFNPTVRYLGRQLAALEGTQAAYPTSSGEHSLQEPFSRVIHASLQIVKGFARVA